MRSSFIFLTLSSLAILAPNTFAAGSVTDEVAAVAKKVGKEVFNDVERQVIEEYLSRRGSDREQHRDRRDDYDGHDKYKNGKKHKGKKDHHKHAKGNSKSLPPGIQKKLARGGALPPGIARTRLPDDVESRLPPPNEGYQRYVSGGKVILVEQATGIISDLISDISTDGENANDQHTNIQPEQHRATSDEKMDNSIEPSPRDKQVATSSSKDKEVKSWWRFWN